MCDQLTSKYSIFLTRGGRISLAGLNEGNIEYVAKAIHDVTDGKSISRRRRLKVKQTIPYKRKFYSSNPKRAHTVAYEYSDLEFKPRFHHQMVVEYH
jgi:hypothetical protein